MIKDRDLTEKRILDAVGKIVEREGFEAVGINAVAAESGVSKILIFFKPLPVIMATIQIISTMTAKSL